MPTTDQQMASRMQNTLMEPANGGGSWTSGLWSPAEVFSLMSLRQDRVLFDTQCLIGIVNIPTVINQSIYACPPEWLRTFGVVFVSADNTIIREIIRSNSFEADHMISLWEATPSAYPYPLVYAEEETATATIQVIPAPTVAGSIDLLFVPSAPDFTGNQELLALPDDFAHVIQYGALADMLGKDGRGKDPTRGSYAEQRFSLAEEAVKIILKGWP